jgi:hypothetical protein
LACIKNKVDSQKIKYISRLLLLKSTHYRRLAADEAIGKHGISIFLGDAKVKYILDPFYQQCLKAWIRISYQRELPKAKSKFDIKNIIHNPFIKDEIGNTIQLQMVVTRLNITKVKDLRRANMTKPVNDRMIYIWKLF